VPIQNIHEYSRYFWGLRHVYCSHVWNLTWTSTDQWVMLGSPEYNANKHLRCLLHIRPSSLTSRNPDAAGLIVFRESHHCSDQHLCHMGVSSGSKVDDSSQMAAEIRWYSYHSIRSFSLGWISITKRGQKDNCTQRGEGSKDVKGI
jgi:hypothetical protein